MIPFSYLPLTLSLFSLPNGWFVSLYVFPLLFSPSLCFVSSFSLSFLLYCFLMTLRRRREGRPFLSFPPLRGSLPHRPVALFLPLPIFQSFRTHRNFFFLDPSPSSPICCLTQFWLYRFFLLNGAGLVIRLSDAGTHCAGCKAPLIPQRTKFPNQGSVARWMKIFGTGFCPPPAHA